MTLRSGDIIQNNNKRYNTIIKTTTAATTINNINSNYKTYSNNYILQSQLNAGAVSFISQTYNPYNCNITSFVLQASHPRYKNIPQTHPQVPQMQQQQVQQMQQQLLQMQQQQVLLMQPQQVPQMQPQYMTMTMTMNMIY